MFNLRTILKLIKFKNLNILDFGCGIGRLSILMKEFEIDCYGIDISTHAINTAKKLARNFGFDMDDKLVVFDGDRIEFKNDFFEVISTTLLPIEHAIGPPPNVVPCDPTVMNFDISLVDHVQTHLM